MTVRDVRQRWQEAERLLESEGEILITRDGKPVARLLPVEAELGDRPKFDPSENRKRRERLCGKGGLVASLSHLQEDREERGL